MDHAQGLAVSAAEASIHMAHSKNRDIDGESFRPTL